MTTLLMSSRHTEDDQALWRAAIRRGWSVDRARGLNLPDIADREIVVYVEALYAATIARMIDRTLIGPSEDWLIKLPAEFKRRSIELSTLGKARLIPTARFVKPPNDKSFAAQIYSTGADLPDAFDNKMAVLVAEPVQWESEYRCFCLDGHAVAVSPYLRSGVPAKEQNFQTSPSEHADVKRFVGNVVSANPDTPRAVVIDVGQIAGKGWAVVEANSAWGSGIYGCNPDSVLDVIRHATVQPKGVS